MRRILSLLTILILIPTLSYAGFSPSFITTGFTKAQIIPVKIQSTFSNQSEILSHTNYQLMPEGLIYLADYMNGNNLNAIYSKGSSTATFQSTRSSSAPATYVDTNNTVITTTTSNVPRFQYGFYDATGFNIQRGVLIETSSLNRAPYSYTYENAAWDKTNITADDDDTGSTAPNGNATVSSLTATANNGTILLATAVSARTYLVWLKRKTGTGTISITGDGSSYTTVTLTSSWTLQQVLVSSGTQKCGIKIGTSGDAVYAWVSHFEPTPYETTTIPNTTSALTRDYEYLTGLTSNNTSDEETIFIKFAPTFNATSTLNSAFLYDTGATHSRRIMITTSDVIQAYPNSTDSATVYASSTTKPAAHTSYVVACVFKHSSPYVEIFVNGISEGTYTAGDYITPIPYGTTFCLGKDYSHSPTSFSSLTYQVVAKFNRALFPSEIVQVSNQL